MTLEELDQTIEQGALASQRQNPEEACDRWAEAWELVKQLTVPSMKSTGDFDRVHEDLAIPVHDWCQDFEIELGNAATRYPKYHELRLRYVDEFLVRFPEESALVTLNMLRAKGEALMGTGRRDQADTVFAATVERFPDDAWAYIGWADQYTIAAPDGTPKNHARAEELLQGALSRTTLVHRDDVLDRLEEIYLDWGQPEKAAAIASERQARFGRELEQKVARMARETLPPEPARSPVVSEKIGRNEPCPCGSGKKYKKCCLIRDAAT